MKKIWFALIIFLFFSASLAASDKYPRNPKADVLHYEFNLKLNDSTDRIEGKTLIDVRLDGIDSISFDLKNQSEDGEGMRVNSVSASASPVTWKHYHDRLVVCFKRTKEIDTLEFAIEYEGIPDDGLIISKNKFGNRVFFADHWPDRAHNYLPCIDHPYDKATVDFIITAPDHYKVVANGAPGGRINADGGMTTTSWIEKIPVPVKVMAFGAADFSVEESAIIHDIPVTTWVFPENMKEGFADYSVAAGPLEYYMDLIGDYPFEKLANVQSKTIYGGLENASCIFYAENSVTGKGRAESLMAHEIAHQWFGDCVSEKDWYHIWLSEGFATYLTSMYFEKKLGEERIKSDMATTRRKVLDYYEKNRKPVIDTTVTDLMALLNPNSYQKGAWVLHMLRNEIGDDAFINGLKLFYQRFRNSNVLTEDFRQVMEETSGKDLRSFFSQWLYTAGQPELYIRQEKGKKKGTVDVTIEQSQNRLFEFDIEIKIGSSRGVETRKIHVYERFTKFAVRSKTALNLIPDPAVKLLFSLVDQSPVK